LNTSGTEIAAARICEEFLSFLLTPAGFSLWIFLSVKKIRRRVTFRVNGLRAALIVSIHAPTSRLAHAPIHVALCCLRNTHSKNRLHRRQASPLRMTIERRDVVGNCRYFCSSSRMLEVSYSNF
jgi:hypothetical protein